MRLLIHYTQQMFSVLTMRQALLNVGSRAVSNAESSPAPDGGDPWKTFQCLAPFAVRSPHP